VGVTLKGHGRNQTLLTDATARPRPDVMMARRSSSQQMQNAIEITVEERDPIKPNALEVGRGQVD